VLTSQEQRVRLALAPVLVREQQVLRRVPGQLVLVREQQVLRRVPGQLVLVPPFCYGYGEIPFDLHHSCW
jgi:hypothetical protein